ncbi:MAG: c-type cytochrome [Actinobacteria bacterium]|nr:c-type cytochrome [Actinomycetota bacterium]
MKVFMTAIAVVVAVGAGIIVWNAYSDRPAEPWLPPAVVRSDSTDGKTLYMRDCAWCHGAEAQGTGRGPNLTERANGTAHIDYVLSTGRMPLDSPDQPMQRRTPIYTQEQIDALVQYAEQQLPITGPAVPELNTTEADLGLGNQLYQVNCAACHASTGIGGALGGGGESLPLISRKAAILAPDLFEATPKEVAEAILAGPGTMPVFGPETFTQRELDSIVDYVGRLTEPHNPGGWSMGRTGPWSEGAAAWLIGLTLMIILIMWIGTRSTE